VHRTLPQEFGLDLLRTTNELIAQLERERDAAYDAALARAQYAMGPIADEELLQKRLELIAFTDLASSTTAMSQEQLTLRLQTKLKPAPRKGRRRAPGGGPNDVPSRALRGVIDLECVNPSLGDSGQAAAVPAAADVIAAQTAEATKVAEAAEPAEAARAELLSLARMATVAVAESPTTHDSDGASQPAAPSSVIIQREARPEKDVLVLDVMRQLGQLGSQIVSEWSQVAHPLWRPDDEAVERRNQASRARREARCELVARAARERSTRDREARDAALAGLAAVRLQAWARGRRARAEATAKNAARGASTAASVGSRTFGRGSAATIDVAIQAAEKEARVARETARAKKRALMEQRGEERKAELARARWGLPASWTPTLGVT
jgi:hypothetical protein